VTTPTPPFPPFMAEGSAPEIVPPDIAQLQAHLAAVIEILDRVGGYMTPTDQSTLRAARRQLPLPKLPAVLPDGSKTR
jgi:hypothetical protein